MRRRIANRSTDPSNSVVQLRGMLACPVPHDADMRLAEADHASVQRQFTRGYWRPWAPCAPVTGLYPLAARAATLATSGSTMDGGTGVPKLPVTTCASISGPVM